MKLQKILIVWCLFIGVAHAQIISVTENYRGEQREISKQGAQIIDINSRLEVSLSKAAILEAIKLQLPQFSKQIDIDQQIVTIREVLQNQNTILKILQQEAASPSEQKLFFNMMLNALDQIESHPKLETRFETFSENYFSSNQQLNGVSLEAYIFSNFNADIVTLKEQLKTIDRETYLVSLVAFKKDKLGGDRVHVKNFDTYTEREYITIERWVTSLSDSQKQQLSELAEIAQANNQLAVNVFQELKTLVLKEFPSVTCLTQLKSSLLNFIRDPQINVTISVQQKAEIAGTIELLKKYETLVGILKTDISAWQITTPFTIANQVKTLINDLETIKVDIGSLLPKMVVNSNLTSKVQPLIAQFNTCYTTLKGDVDQLKIGIELLFNKQENYIANKTIGDEVIAFSLDNLPQAGFVNLKGTGQRANGDQLLLEVILRIPSKEKGIPEQHITLEEREFDMHLIGVRSEVAVGLIFANPFDKNKLNLETDRDFYYAPSASLVLKFGSKSSYFYNDFLDLGVGLNFAAPDFDTNGTPEFGTGLIATAFKDIVSVGLNYNVTLDHFYWFFGVNLPFNLPGLPVNTIKP